MSIKNGFLMDYLKRYKWSYMIGMLLLLAVDYFQMFIPQITGMITDGVTDGSMDQKGILQMVLLMIGITLTLGIGRIGWRYFIVGTSRKVERDVRTRLFAKWVTLDTYYFNTHKTGNLMAYATNDLNAIKMMMGNGIIIIFDAIIMTVMVIIKMAMYVDSELTLIAVIPMPLIAISSYWFGKRIRVRFGKKQEAFAKLSDKVQESFSGIKVIKAFVQEYYDMKDFKEICEENYDKNIHLTKLSAVLNPLMTFLVGVSLLIAIGYGGYKTMINEISIGDFVAFNQYILMLSWPMTAIAMGINVFAQGLASAKRIEEVLNEVPGVKDEGGTKVLGNLKGEIEIRNLNFSFPDSHQIALKDINLHIKPGQTLAILGKTGSGKSTFVNALLRLYNSPEGMIFFDGQDIMQHTVESVRQKIAYVPQDNFLFSTTVGNNIAFGKETWNEQNIIDAAKQADVHQNIIDFPEQYNTVVGEKGVALSGGQKQRVSIARALILDTPILILDDSLSAVDTRTEEQILQNLRQARKDKTTLVIAHRISTVRHADHIIVLDEGRIVESGNHEALLAQGGLYEEMNRHQKLEQEIHEA